MPATRTGGSPAGKLAQNVSSDLNAAISEGHAPASGVSSRRTRGGGGGASAAAIAYDDDDHKLAAIRKAAMELVDGVVEDRELSNQARTTRTAAEAIEGTLLAHHLGRAVEFSHFKATEALESFQHYKGGIGDAASCGGKKRAVVSSSLAAEHARRAKAAVATLKLAVSALLGSASACSEACKWGTKGEDDEAKHIAADAIYKEVGEGLWSMAIEE